MKEREIRILEREATLFKGKLIEKEKKQEKRNNRQSNRRLNSAMFEELTDSIKKTEMRITKCEEKQHSVRQDQVNVSTEIMRLGKIMKDRATAFKRMKNEKDFKKKQQIKRMHEKKDIELKIKFFIDKIIEKNHIDRNSMIRISLKKGEFDTGNQGEINGVSGGDRYSSPEMYGVQSNLSLTNSEMTRFNTKKQKFEKRKQKKNKKLDPEESCGSSCQNGCAIF